jgi:hypothetical protein
VSVQTVSGKRELSPDGVIDPGGRFLEADPEAPGVYHCDTCEITIVQTSYILRERCPRRPWGGVVA